MITYEFGRWGVGFILQLKGSVFPLAFVWAFPNALLVFVLITLFNSLSATSGMQLLSSNGANWAGAMAVWSGFSGTLGFLLIFRTQIAYARFWEGATILHQVRGVWFNATSNLFAFCNAKDDFQARVDLFQHKLIRMMSMLYCAALQQVAVMADDNFEIIGIEGFDAESLAYLCEATDRCEVLMQWVQRTIVVNMEADIVKIAPPIVSRVFQELSTGVVNIQNARTITDLPFPFPYAQMLTAMLILHWTITPFLAAFTVPHDQKYMGTLIVFITLFSLWCLNYTAAELEMPFGDDANDLPMQKLMQNFNDSLITLLHPLVQQPPGFENVPTGNDNRMSRLGRHSRFFKSNKLSKKDSSPRQDIKQDPRESDSTTHVSSSEDMVFEEIKGSEDSELCQPRLSSAKANTLGATAMSEMDDPRPVLVAGPVEQAGPHQQICTADMAVRCTLTWAPTNDLQARGVSPGCQFSDAEFAPSAIVEGLHGVNHHLQDSSFHSGQSNDCSALPSSDVPPLLVATRGQRHPRNNSRQSAQSNDSLGPHRHPRESSRVTLRSRESQEVPRLQDMPVGQRHQRDGSHRSSPLSTPPGRTVGFISGEVSRPPPRPSGDSNLADDESGLYVSGAGTSRSGGITVYGEEVLDYAGVGLLL
eukprot:TRINITY_DN6872_c0_g1_i2.p1 TRINITY_DN6872_c0_g1~~TRINITY_DN6872_c0_g1_i2.p1  ORF type:complete len:646 (+),score=98.01 TRINITY_DN6872_c0_g1_i2:184-2121(+)